MCVRVFVFVPDSMVLITDKFWGPSGAESVIGGVHLWLAEAINALQDNRDILTAKVRAGGDRGRGGASTCGLVPLQDPCALPPGHPGLWEPQGEPSGLRTRGEAAPGQAGATREASHGHAGEAGERPSATGPWVDGAGGPSGAPHGLTAALQVSEAKTQLRDAQDFWISLPGMLCSEKMAMSSASDDRCWNGMAKGRWVPPG